MFQQVHHLGFAVNDLDRVIDLMKKVYNLEPDRIIEISDRQMKAVMFKAGETFLEYLAPTTENSPLYRRLQEKGEGFHHIAFLVENINEAKKQLPPDAVLKERSSNVGNWRIADLDPKYSLGLTSQLISYD